MPILSVLLLKLVLLHLSMLLLLCRLPSPVFRVRFSLYWVSWYPQPLPLSVPVLLSDTVLAG